MWRDFRSDLIYYAAARTVYAISWIAILALLTNRLSTYEYGTYSLLFAAMTVVSLLSTGWLSTSFVRFHPEDAARNHLPHFRAVGLRLSGITVLLSVLVFMLVLFLLRTGRIVDLSHTAALTVLCAYFGMCLYQLTAEYFRAARQVSGYLAIVVVQVTVFLAGCFVFLSDSRDKLFVTFLALAVSYLPFGLAKVIGEERRPRLSVAKLTARTAEYLRYGTPLVLVGLSIQLNSTADQYVLRYFMDTSAVGTYAAYYLFSEKVVFVLATLVTLAGVPIIFREWERGDKRSAYRMLWRVMLVFSVVTLPLFVILLLQGNTLAAFLIDARFADGRIIIPYVAGGAILAGYSAIISDALTIRKKTVLLAKCYLSASLVNVVTNILVIPYYGLLGAAFCTFGSYLYLACIVTWHVQRVSGLFTYADGFRNSLMTALRPS